jgi:branched-chain amino acid transport system permease protein
VFRGKVCGAPTRPEAGRVTAIFPPEQQARAAALQIVAIGVLMAAILLLRPRGLLGEQVTVSRHVEIEADI